MAEKQLNILIGARNLASGAVKKVSVSIKKVGAVARGSNHDLVGLGVSSTSAFAKAAKSVKKYRVELGKAKKDAKELWDQSKNKMASGAKTMAVGAAIAAPLALSAGKAMNYQEGLAELSTLMPTKDLKTVEKEFGSSLLNISKKFGQNADTVVKSAYQAVSAGIDPTKKAVNEFLAVAGKAAVGGVSTMEVAVDGISSVVNAYGKDMITAGNASDLMFTAVRLGKTTFNELASSLYHVTPTASALGVQFSDVTASLAALTAQGTPTSVATTQMNQLFSELAKKSTGVSKIFSKIAGKSFKEFIAGGKNTQDALKILEGHARSNKLQMVDLFGSIEAGKAAMSLTGKGTNAFSKALKGMGKSARASETAYIKMASSTAQKFKVARAAFENTAITMGTKLLPAITKLLSGFTPLIDKVSIFMEQNPQLTKYILLGTAALSGFVMVMGAAQVAIGGMLSIKSLIVLMKGFKIATLASKAVTIGYSTAIKFLTAHKTLFVGATKLSTWTLGLSKVAMWGGKIATYAYSGAQKAATIVTSAFSAVTGLLKGSLIVSKIALIGSQIATWGYTAAQWAMNTAIGAGILPIVIIAAGAVAWFSVIKDGMDVTNDFGQSIRVLTSGLEGLAAVWQNIKGFAHYIFTGEINQDAIESVKRIDEIGRAKKIGRYDPKFIEQQKKAAQNPNGAESLSVASALQGNMNLPDSKILEGLKLPGNMKLPAMPNGHMVPQIPAMPMQRENKIEINYNPVVKIEGAATEKNKESFKKQLKEHSNDILKMVKQGLKREAQLAY